MSEALYLHPDLYGVDLRRPFKEWPASVRMLIAEREKARREGADAHAHDAGATMLTTRDDTP